MFPSRPGDIHAAQCSDFVRQGKALLALVERCLALVVIRAQWIAPGTDLGNDDLGALGGLRVGPDFRIIGVQPNRAEGCSETNSFHSRDPGFGAFKGPPYGITGCAK